MNTPLSILVLVGLGACAAPPQDMEESSAASSEATLAASDGAGSWTGRIAGTFQNQPAAFTLVLDITGDGAAGQVEMVGAAGTLRSQCQSATFAANGLAIVGCKVTDGPPQGAESIVHYALTKGRQQLVTWVNDPSTGTTLSGALNRL